jgi:hypothetical protein
MPIGGPQPLRLRQRHAQAWHFRVLRFDLAREIADDFTLGTSLEGRVR